MKSAPVHVCWLRDGNQSVEPVIVPKQASKWRDFWEEEEENKHSPEVDDPKENMFVTFVPDKKRGRRKVMRLSRRPPAASTARAASLTPLD